MPNFEFEFNQQDNDLVVSQDVGTFLDSAINYIRLTIYPSEAINNIVTLPGTDKQAIFYSSLNSTDFNINVSPFGVGLDEFRLKTIGGSSNDFRIYQNPDGNIYIKPNDIFNDFELPQGDYRIQIDFLNQLRPSNLSTHYKFIIKQVSTSRKEVRLKILDDPILNNSDVITNITNEFNNNEPEFLDDNSNNPNYKYQFKHILNIGTGDHIPIMNYAFDAVTDGTDNQSIILKLYEPLPTNVGNLSMVTIEKEVLTTQTQDIFYFSDVPDVFFGDGLIPQQQQDWINSDNNEIGFENYDELSGSNDNITMDNLISSSEYNYPNLNTDFNEFVNHTFFGSAKKKLQNFKTKIETIQGYYSDISSSLSISSSIGGDSTFVIQKRKNLFEKINKEIKTFSPYERFLYYDGQSDSTSSAPALKNYAHTDRVPVGNDDLVVLNNYDGFDIVYQHTTDSSLNSNSDASIDLFVDTYRVHEKPFFNYSGSIYLSFVLKGDDYISQKGVAGLKWDKSGQRNNLNQLGIPLPQSVVYQNSLQVPSITGSEYRRFIYQTSQSYWIPNQGIDFADLPEPPGRRGYVNDSSITILGGSVKTGSYKVKDSTGKYPTTVVTQSGVPFYGACMPAGELFRIHFQGDLGPTTSSFITDVKVTLQNPANVLPFDNVYKTTSTEWTDWYNDMLTKAENFDTDNIHSFENNLPLYIQESSKYNEMKDFLNLQGEQYDLIKNHIDSMGTIHKRGYKKTNSPPDNTLPMLLSNMGWEAVNPFSGSLSNTLGNYLTGVTSINDIKNNTWRKTLNNLLYIYKSKGTKNSVRALLNIYGYPPDVLEFQEFGGSTKEPFSDVFNDTVPQPVDFDLDLNRNSGSFSFNTDKKILYTYRFGSQDNRVLNLDWWMDSANLNTIEFLYKHNKTENIQTILKSSGSGAENLWDLRLVPSSDGVSSSFQFRLNNSETGSLAIASNALSMSTAYSKISDGQLWNVMLQRMTGSTSTNITNEYRLHSSLQNDKSIETYNYVTMSVSGGLSIDNNNLANQNFIGSGSRHQLSSSNLVVGENVTASLAEIRGWATALSTSKFRQHTLNKFSTVGNTINSHKDELVYRFKLNENYRLETELTSSTSYAISSSAQIMTIVDSSPTTTYSDYSFTKKASVFFTGSVYNFDYVNRNTLTMQDNISKRNDNTILINPKRNVVNDLSPITPSVESLTQGNNKPLFKTSKKLELYRSPQTFVDDFIVDNLGGFNLETLYGNPISYYSQSYDEFITFKENFFKAHPISVDTNKFIRAHESMFNNSIAEGLKSLVPARSTFSGKNSDFGVEIKPTILEKQKYQNKTGSIEVNPNTFNGSINSVLSSPTSEYILPKSGSISVNVTNTSTYEQPKSASISVNVTNTTTYELPKSGSILVSPSTSDSTIVLPKTGSIDYASIANKSFENIHKNWGRGTNDVYFINYFNTGSTSATDKYNTYHIDTRFVFHTIGDNEHYSSSNASDFTNPNNFYNRLMIDTDFHADVSYESLIGATNTNHTGRMMGKTRYFITSSDGEITLPSNHITKFSNPFKDRMYTGAQNTNPGFLNVRHEDLSSASFYRAKVTGGETELRVVGGNPSLGGDDKIIYG